jgi:hypothetical protein
MERSHYEEVPGVTKEAKAHSKELKVGGEEAKISTHICSAKGGANGRSKGPIQVT